MPCERAQPPTLCLETKPAEWIPSWRYFIMQPAINANHSADDLFSQQQASIVRQWDTYDKKQKLQSRMQCTETAPPGSEYKTDD